MSTCKCYLFIFFCFGSGLIKIVHVIAHAVQFLDEKMKHWQLVMIIVDLWSVFQ